MQQRHPSLVDSYCLQNNKEILPGSGMAASSAHKGAVKERAEGYMPEYHAQFFPGLPSNATPTSADGAG
jgi:hypothetical protein